MKKDYEEFLKKVLTSDVGTILYSFMGFMIFFVIGKEIFKKLKFKKQSG